MTTLPDYATEFSGEFGGSVLQEYVGAPDSDAAFAVECFVEASMLVSKYVGAAEVPLEIRQRAMIEVGSELYHRRQAPMGIAQFSTIDNPVRIARDPMNAAYPLLNKWVLPF